MLVIRKEELQSILLHAPREDSSELLNTKTEESTVAGPLSPGRATISIVLP
jgi:hypothetical protein